MRLSSLLTRLMAAAKIDWRRFACSAVPEKLLPRGSAVPFVSRRRCRDTVRSLSRRSRRRARRLSSPSRSISPTTGWCVFNMTSRSSWFRRLSSDLHGTDIARSSFAVATFSLEMRRRVGNAGHQGKRNRVLGFCHRVRSGAHCHDARLECAAIPGGLPVGSGGISLSADAHQAGTTLNVWRCRAPGLRCASSGLAGLPNTERRDGKDLSAVRRCASRRMRSRAWRSRCPRSCRRTCLASDRR